MSIKREIAKYKIRQRKKQDEEIRRLTAQRNKAIKDANLAIRRAQLIEDRKDAEARRARARAKETKGSRNLLNDIVSGVRKLARDISGEKPKHRRVVKRKVTKRRATAKRR